MGVSAYLFELRQIQRFIFSTGKLRDVSGASELLDDICNDTDGKPHGVGGLAGELIDAHLIGATVYRAAGGALDLSHGDAAAVRAFRAAFRLRLAKKAPGLVFSDAIGDGSDVYTARNSARNAMSDEGPVRGVNLPLGAPILRPAPRSGGNPALLPHWTIQGKCPITDEYAEIATHLARWHLQNHREILAAKFLPQEFEGQGYRWPTVFPSNEAKAATLNDGKAAKQVIFPFVPGNIPRIAVLHADGNGMGAIFKAAVDKFKREPEKVRELSRALSKATQEAVQQAMVPVLKMAIDKHIPARPIVLGGDDISIILRADLAPAFAQDFIAAYEVLASEAVRALGVLEENQKLTSKVGFVVIGPSQPFLHAYGLAESLASAARDPNESRIAFHRVAGAAIAGAASDLEKDGRGPLGHSVWRAAHSNDDMKALTELARLLDDDDVGRGGLRKVAELLKDDPNEAQRVYARALDVLATRNPAKKKELVDLLTKFGVTDLRTPGWCPLLQAHDLSHIFGRVA